MQDEPTPKAPPQIDAGFNETTPAKRIASSELFGAAREIVIEHGGRLYRMRITQNGKLILTA